MVREIRELHVGASLLDRLPVGGTLPAARPATSAQARGGLALLRDLAADGRLVHDRGTGELDNALRVAQVRESLTGLQLVAQRPDASGQGGGVGAAGRAQAGSDPRHPLGTITDVIHVLVFPRDPAAGAPERHRPRDRGRPGHRRAPGRPAGRPAGAGVRGAGRTRRAAADDHRVVVVGLAGDWNTPSWHGHTASLTDIAWACLDLNASLLATMPPYLVNAAPSAG